MTKTLVGLFDKSSAAYQAVQQLLMNGFTEADVDVSTTDSASIGSDNEVDSGDENESGFTKFFKNLFGDDDDDVQRYSSAARGKSIVTVHAKSDDEAENAAGILDGNGAADVDQDAAGGTYSGTGNADETVKVIEEKLEVGKRSLQTGGKRLRSRIVERPVQEELRLREERVTVNRTAVNRDATDADLAAFKEGEIEMVESSEVPVVNKQARVVEEVSLSKEVTERNETIKDTVKKTEVNVEDIKSKE